MAAELVGGGVERGDDGGDPVEGELTSQQVDSAVRVVTSFQAATFPAPVVAAAGRLGVGGYRRHHRRGRYPLHVRIEHTFDPTRTLGQKTTLSKGQTQVARPRYGARASLSRCSAHR